MKSNITVGQRVLSLFIGLLLIAVSVVGIVNHFKHFISPEIVHFAYVVIIALIGVYFIDTAFINFKNNDFVIENSEYGNYSISNNAVKSIVKKYFREKNNIEVKDIIVKNNKNKVDVLAKMYFTESVNVAESVKNIQNNLKENITSTTGLEISKIKVVIDDNDKAENEISK